MVLREQASHTYVRIKMYKNKHLWFLPPLSLYSFTVIPFPTLSFSASFSGSGYIFLFVFLVTSSVGSC